eukprot:SAG11_NODE_7342_length_1158_cov_1.710104_1_plen_208_part_00
MLQNAGFIDVRLEDMNWDAAARYDEADHRRPDISTCLHPVTRAKWVLDVVVWWGDSEGVIDGAGAAAIGRERFKNRRYERAMQSRMLERHAHGTRGGMVDVGLVERAKRFVPLGFETGGAFGRSTNEFLREVEGIAGGQSSTDLYRWSGAEWRSHWRQRLSLRLAVGHAALVLGAVESVRCNADAGLSAVKASLLEWTETGCHPCVN